MKSKELNILSWYGDYKEDLEELKNNPNVEGIYYDHPAYLLLDSVLDT